MGLKGKLVGQEEISFDGDIYYEIWSKRPHHLPDMCTAILGVEGQWGTVGSIIIWKFTHDGEAKMSEDAIDAIDDEKKMVKFRVVGGDILKSYKSLIATCEVNGNLVTWTFEYEKVNEQIPDPVSYLEIHLGFNKEMEDYHAKLKP